MIAEEELETGQMDESTAKLRAKQVGHVIDEAVKLSKRVYDTVGRHGLDHDTLNMFPYRVFLNPNKKDKGK